MDLLFFAYYLIGILIIIVTSAKLSILTESIWIGIAVAIFLLAIIHLARIFWCVSFVRKQIFSFVKEQEYFVVQNGKFKYPELRLKNTPDYSSKIKFIHGNIFRRHTPVKMAVNICFSSEEYINCDLTIRPKTLADVIENFIAFTLFQSRKKSKDIENLYFIQTSCEIKIEKILNFRVMELLLSAPVRESCFALSKRGTTLCCEIRARSAYIASTEEFLPHFFLLREINNNLLFHRA